MIISHKHKYIFFKPMKVAGSSVEAALGLSAGPDDILTGTAYIEERNHPDFDYSPQNNFHDVVLNGLAAVQFIKDRVNDPQGPEDEALLKYLAPEVLEQGLEIQHVKTKFSGHMTPPSVFDSKYYPVRASDYFKFTVLRNPWDLCVSYFWWSYYPMKVGVADNKGKLLYPTKDWNKILMPAHLKPVPGDDIELLQRKFAGFLIAAADWTGVEYGQDGIHKTIDWLANYTQQFLHDSIDYIIQFSTLESDFQYFCQKFKLPVSKLPHFKRISKKPAVPYSTYYTPHTRDLVGDRFERLIMSQGYKFNF